MAANNGTAQAQNLDAAEEEHRQYGHGPLTEEELDER